MRVDGGESGIKGDVWVPIVHPKGGKAPVMDLQCGNGVIRREARVEDTLEEGGRGGGIT
jgi:hypothetical protein